MRVWFALRLVRWSDIKRHLSLPEPIQSPGGSGGFKS